ncbi:flagellar hook-associated protein FlgK [Clostridium sp. D2Q-11]|uniref:Flagellar hook-associated protein 1 n=1 Tax=Anaeromonas frigoriresistens TaxID=2683708 RepID=A0A942Z8C6_9FIRM|nr:flagellar hook-associated protein FlgK [Anaeromonas frigoriresistens]MBS4538148.1 flagellar hook-associated protein FlgK [Anaeromonas frigoriresistens]
MNSTFGGLSTAISGLYSNKKALDTVSHNIANADNPTYIRQDVVQSSRSYYTIPGVPGQIGSGVSIQEIRQIRDEFLDIRFRDQSNIKGYWEARNDVFYQVQEILNEMTGTGLQKVMDQLWNGFEELSKDPSNLTIRGLVKERVIAFTETVNHMSDQIDLLQINLNENIYNSVQEVNNISKEIANLNRVIMESESDDRLANDMRDKRNGLLDRLSNLVNIKTVEKSNSCVDVYVGGVELVSNNNYREMEPKNINSSFYDVYWKDMPGPVEVEMKSGYILGLVKARGDVQNTILGKNNGAVDPKVDVKVIDKQISPGNPAINDILLDYESNLDNRNITHNVNNTSPDISDINKLIDYVSNETWESGAHKKIVIATDNSIVVTQDNLNKLKELGVSISIISDQSDGWSDIAVATGGTLFSSSDSNLTVEDVVQETTDSMAREMGYIDDYTEIIPSIKQKLNAFVNTFTRNINYIHEKGKTLSGDPGEAIFKAINPSIGLQAGNIALNPKLNTLNNFAVSQDGDNGDGIIGEEIAELRDKYIFGNLTSDNFYRSIISEIGVAANESMVVEDTQNVIIQNIVNEKSAISSVSMDEEMTNMLKFQHSYTANSRVVNAIDEMIENIVNKMGRVGN